MTRSILARLRAWPALLALLATLALAAPAALADHHKEPGANAPTAKEQVQLYREADKVVGRVSIPDEKLAVLVQPQGREWREFRTTILRIVAGILIVGMVALLVFFFMKRGRIRIESGRSGRTVERFNTLERATHWLTAVSFIVLALTGLVVTFGRPLLIPLIGHPAFTGLAQASKTAHNFFSLAFVLGILLMLVLWIKDNLPERGDLTWLKSAGGLFGGAHPEAGRFNAGQKLLFWLVVLGGGALAVSGFVLMTPFAYAGIGGMQLAHIVHAVLAALLITVIIGHIYIGSIGMEGAFDAMGSGQVDENWAKEHHAGWYAKVRGRAADSRHLPAE